MRSNSLLNLGQILSISISNVSNFSGFLTPSSQYRQFFNTICRQFWPIFDTSPPTNGRRRLWMAPIFDPESFVEKRSKCQTKVRKTAFKSQRSEIWQSRPLPWPHMHLVEMSIFSLNNVTYQNYEQIRQKLGTFLENKVH